MRKLDPVLLDVSRHISVAPHASDPSNLVLSLQTLGRVCFGYVASCAADTYVHATLVKAYSAFCQLAFA